MILRSAPASPFGRMVKIAAYALGVMDNIEVVEADTADPSDNLRQQNPIGKIPALLVDDRVIYDSRVILEYLDMQAGGGQIIPAAGEARLDVLVRNARANGILDAALLVVYESRFRPEAMRVEEVVENHRGKIRRGLDDIAREEASYGNGAMPDISEIGLACTLDYLDFRKQVDWRDHCPAYAAWMQDFAASVPGYQATLPPGIDAAPWRQPG